MSKTLVIYHYYEKDSVYRDNLLHFLTFGYSEDIDYIIVISGNHTLDLPSAQNIQYMYTENLGNDFGGYCRVINNTLDINKYEFFIFINSSVRGPFLMARDNKAWTNYFIDQLQEDVGMVGSTINILPISSACSISYIDKFGKTNNLSHVQSTSYLLPKKSLAYLIKEGFFDSDPIHDKEAAIRDYEVRLSQLIKQNGWNLKCLLPEYNLIDYRSPHVDINPTSDHGDPCFKDAYFGRTIHPHEIIFIKTNRQIYSTDFLQRLAYSLFSIKNLTKQILKSKDLEDYCHRINMSKNSIKRLSFIPLLQLYKMVARQTIRTIKGKTNCS